MKNVIIYLTASFFLVSSAIAIDHKNLDENRPLRLEDPYPVAEGEWVVETGLGFSVERQSSDHAYFPFEVLYGPFPNLQLEAGTILFTDPREVKGQTKSGDLQLSALYNFNQETLTMPAFGLKTSFNLPTGVRSQGTDFEIKGIVTKSFDRLSLHLNAGYELLTGTAAGERDGRYEFVFGASFPLGAPKHTRTILVADVFTEQSEQRGDSNIAGIEAGIRHQLTQRTVLDFGLGSELAGPSDRSSLFITTGFSIGF